MEQQKIKKTKIKNQNNQRGIMSKNVTDFRHFLSMPHITQNDITWSISLRNYQKPSSQVKYESVPPVYYKTTKTQQLKQSQHKSGNNKINVGQFDNFIGRQKISPCTNDFLNFHASLRDYPQNKTNNTPVERFKNNPKVQRKQYPSFLKKDCIKKLGSIGKQNTQSAFDGENNFPEYSQKIVKNKNFAAIEHIFCQKNIKLPSIAWYTELRNYK